MVGFVYGVYVKGGFEFKPPDLTKKKKIFGETLRVLSAECFTV